MAARGIDHGRAQLDEHEVLSIYKDPCSLRKIAAKHNISHSTVQAIKSGRVWSHVTRPEKNETDTASEPPTGIL